MPVSTFIIADSLVICKMEPEIGLAVLSLLSMYYLVDMHYPSDYAQILGLFQHACLGENFPDSERKTGFNTLIQLF